MTLRRRLTIIVTVVLALTMAGFAWFLVHTTRAELTRQLSDAVLGAAARDTPFPSTAPTGAPTTRPKRIDPTDVGVSGGRRVARLLYDAQGELLNYQPSGFNDDPDPIVDLPKIGSAEQKRMVDELVIRRSDDGSIRYLVMTRAVRDGRVRFDAVSMQGADNTIRRLTIIAVLASAVAILGASIVTAFSIRRNLVPVEEMVETSERIASGDLTARVPLRKGAAELGRLGGALNEMLTTIEDAVGERDAKEEELRRFIADASHELRTPITVVQGYSDLYRAGALTDPSQLDKAMSRIESQTERMARLVNDLLLLANLDRPEFITRSTHDVAALAADALNDYALVAPHYPATFESTGPALADVDAQRIRQVLDNLLHNVTTHTAPGTAVRVAVVTSTAAVTVIIQDSGPGIAAADLRKVFQRFWRANGERSSESSGLGLAIVESIVTAHDGSLRVQSNAKEGTTFTISLPVRPPVE